MTPSADAIARFVRAVLADLRAAGLGDVVRDVDHVCYRVATVDRYETLKRALAPHASLLSEAFVNGRPIAAYKLATPVPIGDASTVAVFELPAPKPGRAYVEGFEHIEVVTRTPLEDVLARFALPFDTAMLKAPINREIALTLPSGLVKFHEASLETIIRREKAALAARTAPPPVALLDFDDTLLCSKEAFLKATHAALERHFQRPFAVADVLAAARPTYPEFFGALGVDDAAIAGILRHFRGTWADEVDRCEVPVGVASVLACLASEGVQSYVWTARDPETTADFIARAGFGPYVHGVFGFDGRSGKPDVSPALAAVTQGRRGVVIGDSRSDAAGAARLGFAFLQAAWVHRAKVTETVHAVCATPFEALTAALAILR